MKTKICNDKDCDKKEKPILEFNKDSSSKDGLQGKCRSCQKRRYKEWRINNSEKKKAYNQQWMKDNQDLYKEIKRNSDANYYQNNRDSLLKKQKTYSLKNNEKIANYQSEYYESNREQISENRRVYYEKNKHIFRKGSAKRRAAKLKATPKFGQDGISQIYEEAIKLQNKDGIPRHVDHIIPLQGKNVSGLHVKDNLRIVTAEENLKKHNKFEN